MIAWTCGECSAKNPASVEGRFCRACGSPRNASLGGASDSTSHRHPEFIPPWEKPGWKDSTPSDPCGEPGCAKTVRMHIEEFRAIVSRPGTVFTRPARIETAADHELKVRAQAALVLKRQHDSVPF